MNQWVERLFITLWINLKKNNLNILEIDLKKLEHNFVTLKSLLNKKTKIIGVVKADAYGGGQLEIVKKLISLGIDALAVGYTPEGINLRKLLYFIQIGLYAVKWSE